MIAFFIHGLIVGFCVAAPVGPIGILCIRRTLRFGRMSGLFSGLGAAAADTFYGTIAAFGLTFISDVVQSRQYWFQMLGAFVLIALGIKVMRSSPEPTLNVGRKTLFKDFISTFFLTLSNPLTAVAFLAIFTGIRLNPEGFDALFITLGIFCGAALWWLLLSEGITLFRKKISGSTMLWINRIAGGLIFSLGLLALIFL